MDIGNIGEGFIGRILGLRAAEVASSGSVRAGAGPEGARQLSRVNGAVAVPAQDACAASPLPGASRG